MNEIHKPVLIVIAGPNGSGKTTITSKILHHEWLEQAVYINPDFIAQEKFGDWNSDDSVLTAVGLLPLAASGVNIDTLVESAQEYAKEIINSEFSEGFN